MYVSKEFFLLLLCSFISFSCNSDSKGAFKKKYYKTGELESSGYYINDSIPIDTIYNFHKNGIRKSIYVYNKAGKLDGIIKTYFEDGNLYHEIPYVNGIVNGFVNEYDSATGELHSREFYFADSQSGDLYTYNKSKIDYYAFYDFNGRKINQIEYDTSQKILKNIRQTIFLDKLSKLNANNYQLILLISNPPKTYNKIELQSLSTNGNTIERDTVNGHNSSIYKEGNLSDSLAQIKIIVNQYDSILNKTIYQEDTKKF